MTQSGHFFITRQQLCLLSSFLLLQSSSVILKMGLSTQWENSNLFTRLCSGIDQILEGEWWTVLIGMYFLDNRKENVEESDSNIGPESKGDSHEESSSTVAFLSFAILVYVIPGEGSCPGQTQLQRVNCLSVSPDWEPPCSSHYSAPVLQPKLDWIFLVSSLYKTCLTGCLSHFSKCSFLNKHD